MLVIILVKPGLLIIWLGVEAICSAMANQVIDLANTNF